MIAAGVLGSDVLQVRDSPSQRFHDCGQFFIRRSGLSQNSFLHAMFTKVLGLTSIFRSV